MTGNTTRYYYQLASGELVDITEPISTDGLDLTPRVTDDTEIIARGPGIQSPPTRVADSPWTPTEVQKILDRGGQVWP